ncbi:MAG: aminodeoxychorismate/anthranilate synthase component II [Candidatus Peribacteraceae bacterium]|nr:aminodeoxychorismate/anthranilate synthase component II [Candidatus Peribacteraceae bacterium]
MPRIKASNILLIDHEDSFTHNLAQQLGSLGARIHILPYAKLSQATLSSLSFDALVLSPGPGSPLERPNTFQLIKEYHGRIPILGVCLGHQCLGIVFGSKKNVEHAAVPLHGKTSEIYHHKKGLMMDVASPTTVARYHSLIVKKVPPEFEAMCWTGSPTRQKELMGMYHKSFPTFGVQFHPESFLTEKGDAMMRNFLATIQ